MTTPVIPMASVEAPKSEPPGGGLTSLARMPAVTDTRWINGYKYLAELPASTARNRGALGTDVGENIGSGQPQEVVETVPWMLEIEQQVSTFQMTHDDYMARAERLMKTYTSQLLERELWTGEIADATGLPHRVLATTDATDVTPSGGPASAQRAVAILTKAVGDAGMGPAMIHAPKDIGIMVPDGWRVKETMEEHGFVVVSGFGYPGTGPDGTGSNWIYATELVNVRLDDIEIFDPGNAFFVRNTSDNTVYVRAQRIGAVDFAGPVFACQVS